MPTWIELRCGDITKSTAAGKEFVARCWSFDNDGLGTTSPDTRKSINQSIVDIEINAKRAGWMKTRDAGWVCPFCASVRSALNKEQS